MWVRNKNKKLEEAAPKVHGHTDYAAKSHSHTMYKNKSDFGVVTKQGLMLYGVGGGAVIPYPDGYNKDNCTILAIEFCPDGGGYKGRLVNYKNYKYLMYAELGDNSVQFGYRNISDTNSNDDKLTGTIRIVLMKL